MSELFVWLNQQLRERGLKGHVYQQISKQDRGWYYVPLYIEMRDAYDKATLMQQIEDAWEARDSKPGTKLRLRPASAPTVEASVLSAKR